MADHNAPERIPHPFRGPDLPTEVYADPGRNGWYFREKMPDSIARFVRADLHEALLAERDALRAEVARLKKANRALRSGNDFLLRTALREGGDNG